MKIATIFLTSVFIGMAAFIRSAGALPVSPATHSTETATYYERLYYTCKVWGFVKYFHSETANCSINLDSILVQNLPGIEYALTNEIYNSILLDIITAPGEPALPTIPLPDIPDSLMYNLNLDWFQDPLFTQPVKDALDTIHARFRPRPHCLVGEAFTNGNPTFNNDILYNSSSGQYPDKSFRLLSLFRYWNILNYFFPYKYIMDQNWDSTLTEMIPLFVEAQDALEYDKALLVLAKRINDSHAFTGGGLINTITGLTYPRFNIAWIENETVITKVDPSVPEVKPGDIIRNIDGVDIEFLRDSIGEYTRGSNDLAVMANVHSDILKGPFAPFQITVENENGTNSYTLERNWSGSQFNSFMYPTGPVWFDTVVGGQYSMGYVDMARLEPNQVSWMMSELWETDAIIFDIRNYPNGTLWYLVNYLFTQPIHIASFTVPDKDYPGVLFWMDETIGANNSSVYDGILLILFDIRTISQAEYTCMGLEQHPGSVKIGSQTMAADGNVSQIFLPGGINTYFTGLGTFYPDYTPTQRVGIIPDIEILPTILGIRQEKDEVLEFAFTYFLTGIGSDNNITPRLKVFPNPFTSLLKIDYELANESPVTIEIRSATGQQLTTIDKGNTLPGKYSFSYDSSALPPGIFFCIFHCINETKAVRVIKTK